MLSARPSTWVFHIVELYVCPMSEPSPTGNKTITRRSGERSYPSASAFNFQLVSINLSRMAYLSECLVEPSACHGCLCPLLSKQIEISKSSPEPLAWLLHCNKLASDPRLRESSQHLETEHFIEEDAIGGAMSVKLVSWAELYAESS